MRLVIRDEPTGPWHQFLGDPPDGWEPLEASAARGERTSGWRLEVEAALVELVKTLGSAVRIVRQGAMLGLLGVWLTNLVDVVGAFTIAAFEATVVGIADGDTLTVLREDKTPVRVRLHGIDVKGAETSTHATAW